MKREEADVIGFQELTPRMLERLEQEFPDYTFVGRPRDAALLDESCSVAVRHSTVRILDAETVWLSPTPEIPGSRYPEQSSCPRVRVRVLLQHKETRETCWFVNTHFDHEGDNARVQAQNQLLQEFNELVEHPQAQALIWGGDLNYAPDNKLYPLLVEAGQTELSEPVQESFHNFGKADPVEKIDYLWAPQGQWEIVEEARALTDRAGDTWLSDHYPVAVTVRIRHDA